MHALGLNELFVVVVLGSVLTHHPKIILFGRFAPSSLYFNLSYITKLGSPEALGVRHSV